jgi:hypothetical protein
LFEAPGRAPGEGEEKMWDEKAFEGRAQLQVGAGNEIGSATALKK